MKGEPLVSFVVPCYNYGRFLGDCIESILGQDEKQIELIVIDDTSTDETPDVLKKFSDSRLITLRHTTNQGHVKTINEGLQRASGNFVTRIDADDRYRKDFLKKTLPIFSEHPEVGLVFGDVSLVDEKGNLRVAHEHSLPNGKGIVANGYLRLLKKNFIPAPTVIARREAWAKALPILPGLSHSDWYLNLKMAQFFPIYYCPEILSDYRVHGKNLHTEIQKDRREEETTFRILDILLSSQEPSESQQRDKEKQRKHILALHYARLAQRYYGFGMTAEARECLRKVVQFHPSEACQRDLWPLWITSLLGRPLYESIKSFSRQFGIKRPF